MGSIRDQPWSPCLSVNGNLCAPPSESRGARAQTPSGPDETQLVPGKLQSGGGLCLGGPVPSGREHERIEQGVTTDPDHEGAPTDNNGTDARGTDNAETDSAVGADSSDSTDAIQHDPAVGAAAESPDGPDRMCHVCLGERPAMDDCPACFGRGVIDWIGFTKTPWDEVVGGLWVGCHDYEEDGERAWAVVGDEFDVVVSLYSFPGHGPDPGVRHYSHRMPDALLEPEDAAEVEQLAALVADEVSAGRKVLVRCQAGLNRSALVAALAMVRLGWEPSEAIAEIRERRDLNCLFNRAFVAYILGPRSPVNLSVSQ